MNITADQQSGHILGRRSEDGLPFVQREKPYYRTTLIERVLLALTLVFLPLEETLPTFANFSMTFMIFVLLAVYVFLNRRTRLVTTALHPVFLTAYALLGLNFFVESLHSDSGYTDLVRIGLMIGGGLLVATLCRDKNALRVGCYSCVAASIGLSVFLFLTSYGGLRTATAVDYHEASRVRTEVLSNLPLRGNLNAIAFFIAEGSAVAFALTLGARSLFPRIVLSGVTLLCLVATFLPISRGGVLILLGSCMVVFFRRRVRDIRAIILVIVFGVGILIWVPQVVFSRMEFSMEVSGRGPVYTAAINHLSEYLITGVGAGNFWESWGYNNGFGNGAHNGFVQVTIFWGLPGLLTLSALVFQAYRCLPTRYEYDASALCLWGIGASLLLWLLVAHTIYDKQFSMGLGLLVGARLWIWPKVPVRPANSALST